MKYDKLVRDKIPDYIRSKGGNPVTHIATEAEYWQKLKEKLVEEVQEFFNDESLEELADILEVIDAIIHHKQFDRAAIQQVKEQKLSERGAFSDRVI